MQARKKVNKLDNLTTGKAVDALLNYETVKLFNNEQFEVHQMRDPISSQDPHFPSNSNMRPCNGCVQFEGTSGFQGMRRDEKGHQAEVLLRLQALCRWMSMICTCQATSRRLWPRRMWQQCSTQARALSCPQGLLQCLPLLLCSALWDPSQPVTW